MIAAGPKPRRLLAIDASADGRARIAEALETQPFRLDFAESADAALRQAEDFYYDVILMNPQLPDRDGLEIVRDLPCPVIVVADAGSEAEIMKIVNSGAADFATRGASGAELAVRLWKLIVHPPERAPQTAYHFVDFELNTETRRCVVGDRACTLTRHEAEFLCTLLESKGKFATYAEIMERVWHGVPVETQNLRVLTAQLRKKIEPHPDRPQLLMTVTGRGYRLAL